MTHRMQKRFKLTIMSQSLIIIGKYRNNKTTSIGTHNPENNRVANKDEINHLNNMVDQHLKPNLWKFKELIAVTYLQSGKKITISYLPRETSLINLLHNGVYRLVNDKI